MYEPDLLPVLKGGGSLVAIHWFGGLHLPLPEGLAPEAQGYVFIISSRA